MVNLKIKMISFYEAHNVYDSKRAFCLIYNMMVPELRNCKKIIFLYYLKKCLFI